MSLANRNGSDSSSPKDRVPGFRQICESSTTFKPHGKSLSPTVAGVSKLRDSQTATGKAIAFPECATA